MGQNVQAGPYGADQMEIQRRQRLAQMLQEQSMQPIQSQGGGRLQAPISPFQVAGQLMKGYTSGKISREAEEKQKTLADRMQSERQAALAKALSQAGGSPQPDAALGGGPAMPGDPMGAAGTLAGSQDPMLAQAGMGAMGKFLGNQMPQQPPAPQPFTLGPGQQRFPAGGGQPTASVPPTPPQPPAPTPFTLGQGQQRFGPDGKPIANVPTNPNQQAGGTPYFTPQQTAEGIYAFNNRTGQMELVKPGVVGSASDPNLQSNLASAKAGGKVRGETQVTSEINLPQTVANAENSKQLIDQMVGSADGKVKPHPGFEGYVGFTYKPGMRFVEGSQEANFEALLEQVKGGAFLEAFQALKGGGHITEIEGTKATDAITRMRKSQSEDEFRKAAREYQQVIDAGIKRAKQKAAGGGAAPAGGGNGLTPQEQQELDALRKRFGR
jgi:hypothetical protein